MPLASKIKKRSIMRLNKEHWLLSKPIAHRGLWNESIVENSLCSYQNAIDNGYPIEIDLYSTTDGKLVSFHDSTLNRMTGVDGFIYDKSYEQLSQLNLGASTEKIPLFDQVLELCQNKTPLLIEIKNQPDKDIVKKVVERLKTYKGEFAIQSFNPLYINQVKKLAPEFIRGILGTNDAKEESFINRFVVKNLAFNRLIKPDFISYSFEDLPLKKRKTKNKCLITWTVTTEEDYLKVKGKVDNVIFEKFVPQK